MKTRPIPNLYRTADVAQILSIEEWRVKNFSQGKAYNLPPSVRVGSGQRRLRLYTFEGVLRLAIADELVKCGFTPEAVGSAMLAISDKQLTSWSAMVADSGHKAEEPNWRVLPVLMSVRGEWKVTTASVFRDDVLRYDAEWRGSFVLNLSALLGQVVRKIKEMEETK